MVLVTRFNNEAAPSAAGKRSSASSNQAAFLSSAHSQVVCSLTAPSAILSPDIYY